MKKISYVSQLFPEKAKSLRLLAIFAHPDDESLQIAGLLSKAAKEGVETFILCLSKGDKGVVDSSLKGNKLKKVREKELMSAAKILRIKKVFLKDFPDGKLIDNQDMLARALKKTLENAKPQVVVTHDPSGITGHPDHITTSLVTKSVLSKYFALNIKCYFVVYPEKLKKVIQKVSLRQTKWQTMPKPTHWLDISPFVDIKEKACLAHRSQGLDKSKSVSLKLWYSLFNREYLHEVNLRTNYKYLFSHFKTPYFNFLPKTKKVLKV